MFGSKFLVGNIWGANSFDFFFGGGGCKMGNNFFLKLIFWEEF